MKLIKHMLVAGCLLYLGLASLPALAAEGARPWKLSSTYPGTLIQLGTLGKRIAEKLRIISGGSLQFRFYEPGALVPALEVFDAVSIGAIESAWGTPGYWAGKEPALQFFGAVPFGPRVSEYLAWFYFGGGRELFEEIYHRHNIHSLVCGVVAPEASGWFREEITSLEQLKGLKIRFFGLGALVMEKLGASTQLLAAGDIYTALELGSIDATEFSMPAVDYALGFHEVAKHYYFPGWHQQSTFLELMINLDAWNTLDDTQRAQIEVVCGDNIRYSIAESEAVQTKALQQLRAEGVIFHRWTPEQLATIEEAWLEVVTEQSARNAEFKRVWESLSTFREAFKEWNSLGYLP